MVKLIAAVVGVAAFVAGTAHAGVSVSKRVARPHHGKTVLVTPKKGHVVVYRRGNRKITGRPVALRVGRPVLVPLGTVVDATAGTAMITSAEDAGGSKLDRGTFSQGAFAVDQTGTSTAISLGGNGPRVCSRPRRLLSRIRARDHFFVLTGARAARPAPAPSRLRSAMAVWVSEDRCTTQAIKRRTGKLNIVTLGSRRASPRQASRMFKHGRFRTVGRYSSATVRG